MCCDDKMAIQLETFLNVANAKIYKIITIGYQGKNCRCAKLVYGYP